ncbi:PSD1 and planctomycete cytochrome C domain-containing protein [Alienimonas californiensis]|uniref:Planctomycete cytochrome C n=1 Tax=Alienimonas californiensis TaxID=2527989 RepID=A0A517PA02_9PLAN|nr:PSD1 and planctomycete cytochrome C domain-containing protein [Alienimonas californiensis]QDT16203.1 Planctomycete cytochrome C [Alienimonas californiensis]
MRTDAACRLPIALVLAGACGLALTPGSAAAAEGDGAAAWPAEPDAETHFTLTVLPLLETRCGGCHGAGADEPGGALRTDSLKALLTGGESGSAAIVPGDPAGGTLMDAITWATYEMPPKEADRLSEKEVAAVRRWIADGAVWPDEATRERIRERDREAVETADGRLVATSGGQSEAWTGRRYAPADLWHLQPLPEANEPLSAGALAAFVDERVGAKLTEAGLEPAGRANPRDLLRRASFDLTGLPPTPEQSDAFLADHETDPDGAWERLIDRLLASPAYGERWARHWLDVARYADTGGMSNDFERSNMWRYRDYVIRAFNHDKPYDEFVLEQLAGDELADASVLERTGDEEAVQKARLSGDYTPGEAEQIVASGFLRLGPWDNAMIKNEEARQIYLDDVVNVTGQAFLSTTMRCAKCHDHKFDPLPTRDYYRLYSAFSTTHQAERPVPFLPEENRERFDEERAHVEEMLAFATERRDAIMDKQEAAARAWFDERGLPYLDPDARQSLRDEEKPPRHVGLTTAEQGELKVREQDVWIWTRRLERFEPMAQSVYNAGAARLAWNGARKLRIDAKSAGTEPPECFIFEGGALDAPGEPVKPGVLSATGLPVPGTDDYLLPESVDGRRLALARWIADPRNPITARSFVNRLWGWHFGMPLAENGNNFGVKGGKPSHPELLDRLAADFVAGGWQLKRLHRGLMLSEAYRRSARHADPDSIATADPDGRLLAAFPRRRLSAEELRDAMLAASGELAPTTGGLPVRPEMNMEVALQPRMLQFSLAPAYQPSPEPEIRNRRTVYAYLVRGQADPLLETFGQPGPNDSCELRETAATVPQAFTLLNGDAVNDRAAAMAARIAEEDVRGPDAVDRAFELALGRPATAVERERLVDFLAAAAEEHAHAAPQPPTYPTRIMRSLVEEFSGEPFEYEEILPTFAAYDPGVKPADLPPAQRALADVCLLLFNSNEFAYVE